ncbi:MAG TPA: cupin domain-containing protein [Candidatus Limnocylindrales bacterium]|nr:cupin domain-containing protein [Candidatus Limnocylindrales bacterium]
MPIEVVRFGVGHRRPDGPPGTIGVTGQVIHNDARGMISELAFARNGRIEPHTNPNTTWFIVIEGGGWVVVDGESLRVAAGEAVLWPPDVPHGAWADHGHMRAFVVELAGPDDRDFRGILEGHAVPALGSGIKVVSRGEGTPSGHEYRLPEDPNAGEPH